MGTDLYRQSDWSRVAEPKKAGAVKESYRHDARRDFARLIHSPAFRRLQGKTQLFPSEESDYFRNRLTHSLEVAQIAKSIAVRLNATEGFLKSKKRQINLDLVEFAGLAHDLGHPPFGHNGEAALDKLMLNFGGFEGNAQTLRILAKLEKKSTVEFPLKSNIPQPIDRNSKKDKRIGLNLSSRTLASILKYDKEIPYTSETRIKEGSDRSPVKGFYGLESGVVSKIKTDIGAHQAAAFKTLECSIMDVADDIAYSTYDIEDCFKAGFLTPILMISTSKKFKEEIADKVQKSINKNYQDKNILEKKFDIDDVNNVLIEIFRVIFLPSNEVLKRINQGPIHPEEASYIFSQDAMAISHELIKNGYLRTAFTSDLVGKFINGIEFFGDDSIPPMSKIRLNLECFRTVETLKHFSFQSLIESPRLKLSERRGKEIINKIYDTLLNDSSILPEDWRDIYTSIDDPAWHSRTVCDYISGMTDRYCVEFYARVTGSSPITMWKPH